MNIKIETYSECRYDEIQKKYGRVLHQFGLTKADDGSAYITINGLEDLFNLDEEINNFCNEQEYWYTYFGILVHNGENPYNEPYLEIKDNYD